MLMLFAIVPSSFIIKRHSYSTAVYSAVYHYRQNHVIVVFLVFPMFIVNWASSVKGHVSLSALVAAYEN